MKMKFLKVEIRLWFEALPGRIMARLLTAKLWQHKPPYGEVDLDRWERMGFRGAKAHTFVDGVDVTKGCVWFDDIRGWALRHSTQPPRLAYGNHKVETVILRGKIEVQLPSDLC